MSFAPVLPAGGHVGWLFLKRTQAAQQAAFAAQAPVRRDEAHFRERIGQIDNAAELVADKRLLRVALGAFGLEADVNNSFFIRKILEDGTFNPKALANRLADKRYAEFSAAFGFGDFNTPRNKISDFPDRILSSWKARQFEIAVGTSNESMRLAMNAERELKVLAGRKMSEDGKWFTVMGQPPLRKVFETAFGLPAGFGALDIDRQLEVLKDRARAILGSGDVAQFADPERLESLTRRFLIRTEAEAGVFNPSARGVGALLLLQGAGRIAPLR